MKHLSLTIPSKPQFQDKVNKILHSAEYKHLNNGVEDAIQKIKDHIEDWLSDSLGKMNIETGSIKPIAGSLSTIFIIIGILVIVFIIVMAFINYRRMKDKRNRIKEILGEKIDEQTTPISLRKKAESYFEKGDFRQAVRYDFIAILLLMHEKNILYLDETKTNEEIYEYLSKNNFMGLSTFGNLINLFNYSWYGHKTVTDENYKSWRSNLELIWNGVIGFEEKER